MSKGKEISVENVEVCPKWEDLDDYELKDWFHYYINLFGSGETISIPSCIIEALLQIQIEMDKR